MAPLPSSISHSDGSAKNVSQEQISIKTKKHRKRHIPAGPAGYWFQSAARVQQHTNVESSNDVLYHNQRRKRSLDTSSVDFRREHDDNDVDEANALLSQQNSSNTRRHRPSTSDAATIINNIYLSQAWTAACFTLNIITPSISNRMNMRI